MTVTARGPVFTVQAYGHPSILATHPTTLEVTTEGHLTSRGNCIVGVRATCSAASLPAGLRQRLISDHGRVRLRVRAGHRSFEVVGEGSGDLTLTHPREMVVRKSGFVSDRTIMVNADKAAKDIPREMVSLMQNPEQLIEIDFYEV